MVNPEKIRIEIKNEIDSVMQKSPAKVLFSAVKTANSITYRIYVIEYANKTRQLIIERQPTKRLPRGFVRAPPAPLFQYIQQLKRVYGIE